MARRKQHKIAEFKTLPNCFKEAKEQKGNWKKWYGNDNPLVLEIGCGKGDLALGLARMHPERNYMGIDMLSARMWVGAKTALEEELNNICFHRMMVEEILEFFAPGEVDEIWITFPDPYPKKRHFRRRLTYTTFLDQYKQLLKPGGLVQFKTDSDGLFEWTLEHFEELGQEIEVFTRDLHNSELKNDENGILTPYERKFLAMGENINYMRFRF